MSDPNVQFTTAANLLGGGPVSYDEDLARGLLETSITAEQIAATVAMEPGERFAVQRGVAVVPIKGLLTPNSRVLERWMGWATYEGISETMPFLTASEDVAAIVLEVDSPGGVVIGTQAAAEAIQAARAVKPVHVLVNPWACSAAYWLASQGTDITVTPGGWVGSIGVKVTSRDPVEPGYGGYQETVINSSQARAKAPDATTEVGRDLLQRRADHWETVFHQAVSLGRNIPLEDLPSLLSMTDDPQDGGAVFDFDEAMARNMVDARMTRDGFYQATFERYAPRPAQGRTRGRAALARAAAARASL